MQKRRTAIMIGCIASWMAALSTVIVELPGSDTERVIRIAAVVMTIIWRTEPPQKNLRQISKLFFDAGFTEGQRAGQEPEVSEPAEEKGKVIRLRMPRFQAMAMLLPAVAVGTMLAVIVVASDGSPAVVPMRPDHRVLTPKRAIVLESAPEPVKVVPVKDPVETAERLHRRAGAVGGSGGEVGSSPRSAPALPSSSKPTPALKKSPLGLLKQQTKKPRGKHPEAPRPRPRPVISSLLHP